MDSSCWWWIGSLFLGSICGGFFADPEGLNHDSLPGQTFEDPGSVRSPGTVRNCFASEPDHVLRPSRRDVPPTVPTLAHLLYRVAVVENENQITGVQR